jgi:hypothetical protein
MGAGGVDTEWCGEVTKYAQYRVALSAVKTTDCLILSGKHQHPRDSITYWLNSFKLRWSLIKQATKDPAYTERKLVLMF